MSEQLHSHQPITTAADQVFVDLRRAIVEGDIEQGSKISEPELAKRFGVSRATLRDALNRLEACNLVERKANVGCRVVALTPERLIEVYQVRAALEGLACRLAAENMADEEIASLKGLLNKHLNEQQILKANPITKKRVTWISIIALLKALKRAFIQLVIQRPIPVDPHVSVQMGMTGPRVSKAFDEHLAIINAIDNRDGELAELLMKRHISHSMNNIENKFNAAHSG